MTYPEGCVQDPEYNSKLEERIVSRMAVVEDIFNDLKASSYLGNCHINRALLFSAVESYYTDIDRIKCFHDISLTDEHKKAAFSMKWLIKFRPIQLSLECDDKIIKRGDILVNERFAIYIGLNLLNIGLKDIDKLSDKYLENMCYNLRFREVDGMILSSMMYLLERGINQEIP
jgi:hypothetical protein